jgi:hypothetical protein
LTRVYAKLGVRSRTELARRLTAETPGAPPKNVGESPISSRHGAS